MGEGAGIIILEELEHALKRGARIYAEIVGYGATGDAYHITAPAPGGEGGVRAMRQALYDANMQPEDIDYINAHGTSTEYNDKYETMAIKEVFGEHAYKLAVSSTKSMTGHLLGAAGAIEAIFSVLSIHDGVIPPTINYETPDPECDLDYVPNVARKQDVRAVLSNSLGFGGHNATIIFKNMKDEVRLILFHIFLSFIVQCDNERRECHGSNKYETLVCGRYVAKKIKEDVQRHLFAHGMARHNQHDTMKQLAEKTYGRLSQKVYRTPKEWDGPDVPIFIFPADATNRSLQREFGGKSGVAFRDQLFLFCFLTYRTNIFMPSSFTNITTFVVCMLIRKMSATIRFLIAS